MQNSAKQCAIELNTIMATNPDNIRSFPVAPELPMFVSSGGNTSWDRFNQPVCQYI